MEGKEEAGGVRVEVVKELIVKPDPEAAAAAAAAAAATAGSIISSDEDGGDISMYLSPCDVFFRGFQHNRRLLFYDPPPASLPYHDLVSRLTSSLSIALSSFFPLAGRLVGDGPGIRLALNGAGVLFRQAAVSGVTIDDLRRLSFPNPPAFSQLAPSFPPELYASVPVFAVQISRFDCGGIALGISNSHVVCDGTSLWHFMTSWAECARGEPISTPPLHKRTLLKVENPSLEKANIHLECVEDEENGHNQGSNTKLNTFHFTKEMVQRLKQKANGNLTSYEVLCGHIWKHASKAKKHKRDKKVCFISILNMRNRMEPPLGYAYFGNSNMWATATATAGELEDEDLATTCKRIQGSIASCTNDAFHNWLHWLETHGRDAIFKSCGLNGARIRASSSHNFPIFKVDFGWGKPCAARCPNAEDEGKIIFFPGCDTHGDIDMVLALPIEVMHQLENDHAFINP